MNLIYVIKQRVLKGQPIGLNIAHALVLQLILVRLRSRQPTYPKETSGARLIAACDFKPLNDVLLVRARGVQRIAI